MQIQDSKIVIETQYLPTIAFFSYLANSNDFLIEAHENYQKGSYRNRTYILSSQGPLLLSIPLLSGKNNQQTIKEVRIDNNIQWVKSHLRGIKSCYGKSPFFEFYFDEIVGILNRQHDFLFDLNLEIIESINKSLHLNAQVSLSGHFLSSEKEGFSDKRGFISPKKKHMSKLAQDFNFVPYDQVFMNKNGFATNLSILDLLFCMGPEAVIYLKQIIKA